MIQWATLIEEDRTSWSDYEKACSESDKKRLEALKRVTARVLESELQGDRQSPQARVSETRGKSA